jgi:hypothetical protein
LGEARTEGASGGPLTVFNLRRSGHVNVLHSDVLVGSQLVAMRRARDSKSDPSSEVVQGKKIDND